MKTLKANIKMLWPHIVILLLLLSGIIVSLAGFININKQAGALHNGAYVLKSAADTVNENLEAMQMSVFRAVSNNSRDITDETIADAENAAVIIQEQTTLLKKNSLADTATISKLEKCLSELTPMQEHVLNLILQNKNSEAADYMESNNIPVIKEAQKELAQLLLSADTKVSELAASLRHTQKITIVLLISFGAVGLLFSTGVGVYILRLQKKGVKAT